MNEVNHKTAGVDFGMFKKEFNYWADKWLPEWRISFAHEDNPELPGSQAWVVIDRVGKIARVGLSVSWKHEFPTKYLIGRSAFHEMCEVLLTDLNAMAETDCCEVDLKMVEMYKHIIIRKLENLVFKKDYEARRNKNKPVCKEPPYEEEKKEVIPDTRFPPPPKEEEKLVLKRTLTIYEGKEVEKSDYDLTFHKGFYSIPLEGLSSGVAKLMVTGIPDKFWFRKKGEKNEEA